MVFFALLGLAWAHGSMAVTKPRNNIPPPVPLPNVPPHAVGCEGLACEWFSQGCNPGCSTCNGKNDDFTSPNCEHPDPNFEPFISANQTHYLTYISDENIIPGDM